VTHLGGYDQQLPVSEKPEPNEQLKKNAITVHTHKKVDSAAHAIFLIFICDDETVLQ
jgi:hypothetical protein